MTDIAELEKQWRAAAIRAAKSKVQAEVDRIVARKAAQAYQAATWDEAQEQDQADDDQR